MKNWTKVMMAGALLAASGAANAQFSATVTAASDYDFRGLTQTARDPALQASLDYAFGESGFAVGVWGSNVDFGPGAASDYEIDYYASYSKELADGVSIGAAYTYYMYDSQDDVDYSEFAVSMGYKGLGAKLWYSDDYGNSGESALYTELNYTHELENDFALLLHAGYSSGDYWSTEEYFDYSVGISKQLGNFSLALKFIDGSDLASLKRVPDDVFTSENKLVLTVSTTFPW